MCCALCCTSDLDVHAASTITSFPMLMLGPPQQAIRHTVEVHRQKCLHAAKETGGQTDASEGRSANGRLKTTQMHTVEISGQKSHHAVTETGRQDDALGGLSANGCRKTTPVHTMQSQKRAVKKRLWVDNQPTDARRSCSHITPR